MGAFVLYRNGLENDLIVNHFQKKGHKLSCIRTFGQFHLLLFKKKLLDNTNCFESDNSGLYVVGTLIYKDYLPEDSLPELLRDLNNGSVNQEDIIGHYFALYYSNGELHYFNDDNDTYEVYFDKENELLSSSFISMIELYPFKLSVNRDILIENISTGGIIGEETVFNQISRLFHKNLKFILSFNLVRKVEIPNFRNITEALNYQISNIDTYCKRITKTVNKYGGDLGITGGYDSRLLMASFLQHFTNCQFHSSKRNYENVEYTIAKLICDKQGLPFHSVDVIPVEDYTSEDYEHFLKEGMYYFDGLIRTHMYWHEGYGNLEYRKSILRGNCIGFNGVGGEQYRNQERLIFMHINFKSWIQYHFLNRIGRIGFIQKEDTNAFIAKYYSKVLMSMDLPLKTKKVDLKILKRFQNEVWSAANRANRANTENANTYYLSPFVDKYLSLKAYSAIDYFDGSLNFEGKMISMINPDLASFTSTYGYSFTKGEPKLSVFTQSVFTNFVPNRIAFYLVTKLKRRKSPNLELLFAKYPEANNYFRFVENLVKRIDLRQISTKADLWPLVLYYGYFLKRYSYKITS